MSRLINPGLGDLLDRLTILALKRQAGSAAGRDTAHFDREWAAIHALVAGRRLGAKWLEAALELGAVNAQLWQATDHLREIAQEVEQTQPGHRDSGYQDAGEVGLAILRLNDQRARLVQQINEGSGDVQPQEQEK